MRKNKQLLNIGIQKFLSIWLCFATLVPCQLVN